MSDLDKDYAKRKLELLLRDLSNYNAGEFWREMSRIASGATGKPHAEELQKRIVELEQELKGPDNYETWKDAAIDERVKRVDAIKKRVALSAHVERLRTSALNAICVMPSGEAKAELRDVYDEHPTTSLNAIKREAFIEGFVGNYKTAYRDKGIAKREANINAKQRYPDKEEQ